MASSYRPEDWFGSGLSSTADDITIDFNNATSGGTGVIVSADQEALTVGTLQGSSIDTAEKVLNESAGRTELEVHCNLAHGLAYGDIVTIEGLTVPTSSASSIYDNSFTDPNQGYMVVGLGEHDDPSANSATTFRVVFSTNEAIGANYGTSSASKVYRGDFRVLLNGIMQGLYNAYIDGRDIPNGFKMSSTQGGYSSTDGCYYQTYSVTIKMETTNEKTPSAKQTGINMEND